MHLNPFRGFAVPDHPIIVKVGLVRNTLLKSHRAKQGVTDSIYYRPLYHIGGRIGIDDHTTIQRTHHALYHRLAVCNGHINHLRRVGVVAKIGGDPPPEIFVPST